MSQQSSAQIQLALNRLVKPIFKVLRDDFAQYDLLGEVFRTDCEPVR